MKRIFKKVLKKTSPFQLIAVLMILLYLPRLFYDMLQGISQVEPCNLAIFYAFALFVIYILFDTIYSGLRTFLFLLFFSFLVYPITSFYLYNSNKGNYLITNQLKLIQKDLAQEKIKREVSIEDLEFLSRQLSISNNSLPIYFPKRDSITIDSKIVSLINPSKRKIIITKSDSIRSEFYIEYGALPPDEDDFHSSIILGLDKHIRYITNLKQLILINTEVIPFSEFWIESITSFSSGHIQPARNIPKLLNGIQILAILFLTTIIINSINGELSLKRKTKIAEKKKKGKT